MPIDEKLLDSVSTQSNQQQNIVEATYEPEENKIIVYPDGYANNYVEKDINWYNNYVPIFNERNNADLKPTDTPDDLDYATLDRDYKKYRVEQYNEANKTWGLGLPEVSSDEQITPEADKKVEEVKTLDVLNKANKELKLAQSILPELKSFKPFESIDDIKQRGDAYNATIKKATTAKTEKEQNKVLTNLNTYIEDFNKQTGGKVKKFNSYDEAVKAITPNKKGETMFEQQLKAYERQHPIVQPITLEPNRPIVDALRVDDNQKSRQRYRYDNNIAEIERAEKLSQLKAKTQKVYNTTLNTKGVRPLEPLDLQYTEDVKGDESYYKDASTYTSKRALDLNAQANELMPEYLELQKSIDAKTEQGIQVPQSEMTRYNALAEDIQTLVDASDIMNVASKKKALQYIGIKKEQGSYLGGIARTSAQTIIDLDKTLINTFLTVAPYLSKDISKEESDEMISKVNKLGNETVEWLTGSLASKEFQESRGGLEKAVNSVIGLLPYLAVGTAKVPGAMIGMMTMSFANEAKQQMLDDERFSKLSSEQTDAIAFTQGLASAIVMDLGLKVGGNDRIIHGLVYDALNNLPKTFGFNTARSYIGRRAMQLISEVGSNSVGFGALNLAGTFANHGVNEIINLATDKVGTIQENNGIFNVYNDKGELVGSTPIKQEAENMTKLFPTPSVPDMTIEAIESMGEGMLTGALLGAGIGVNNAIKQYKVDFGTFKTVDDLFDNPHMFNIYHADIRNLLKDKKITPKEAKERFMAMKEYRDIASQIPKNLSTRSRFDITNLMLENKGLEKQKEGLSPLFTKGLDNRIAENEKEITDIFHKNIQNDAQNIETPNSESTTTDGTSQNPKTEVADNGNVAETKDDVVEGTSTTPTTDNPIQPDITSEGKDKSITEKGKALADKIRELKSPKGSMQTDFTLGLKDTAIEAIALLVEGGAKVIDAINTVLKDEKYKGLDANKIKESILKLAPKEYKLIDNQAEVVNGFYHPVEKSLHELPQDKWGSGDEALKSISKGISAEELKWTGLQDWLTQQGKVSKQDILDYLKDNRVQLVEVVKDSRNDVNNWNEIRQETKFNQYQLEGDKSNYREILVTMPSKEVGSIREYAKTKGISDADFDKLSDVEYHNLEVDWRKQWETQTGKSKNFKSSHWDEPNIIGHLRISNRVDAEGNKVLHISEVQSDWGQKGKKEGFKQDTYEPELKRLKDEAEFWAKKEQDLENDLDNQYHTKKQDQERRSDLRQRDAEFNKTAQEYNNAQQKAFEARRAFDIFQRDSRADIPSAPFVTNTSNWTKLLLKYAIREAVKDGATKVTWETGETQNERYDLSKQVDEIDAKRNKDGTYEVEATKDGSKIFGKSDMPLKEVEDTFGKDIAEKFNNSENRLINIKGDNLKAGGKGMIGFYGSPTEGKEGIVGKTAKELVKELTGKEGKIGETKIEINKYKIDEGNKINGVNTYDVIDGSGNFITYFETKKEAENYISDKSSTTQHSIEITPELKESVQKGMPLFSTPKSMSIGDKVRSLKSKKGTLQSDITGGLKDLILEDIAQFLDDGMTVIDAIKKAFKNSKYAKLDKDEIRGLVFTQFPLTDKDFERAENERIVDRDKRLTDDLKERGYAQNEIDYIIKNGVKGIDKVEMVREETKVVDNLNKILKDVKAKDRFITDEKAVDKAIEYVQHEWNQEGKEIILENAIRKFKKEHGFDAKTPTDRAVKPKPIKISVDEKKALVDQIKLEVKAAKEGAKSITDGFKTVAKVINDILKEHKTTISTKQLNSIQKRMAMLKVGSNESVRKYVDYVEKVLADAEYADQLSAVKSTNKKLKKLLKNDKIPASVRNTANDFLTIDAMDVQDLNKHETIANELYEAMKSGGVKVVDGQIVDKTRKSADLEKINSYIERERQLAEERANEAMAEEYEETPENLASDEPSDAPDRIKEYVKNKFNNLKSVVGKMLESGKDIFGVENDFTKEEISLIKKVMGMKLDELKNVKDWYEATEALDHLITNGDLGLIPRIVNKYEIAVKSNEGIKEIKSTFGGKVGMLRISKMFAGLRSAMSQSIKDHQTQLNYFNRISFGTWDNAVKNFKSYGLFDKVFSPLGQGYSNMKTVFREMDAEKVRQRLFVENGFDSKENLISAFKITAFLRQLEYESNPNNKKVLPAIDYLKATIEAGENRNHPIQDESLDILKQVVKDATVDGQINLEVLRKSLSFGEKEAIRDLRKIYKDLAPFHTKVALAIRNKPFTAIDNYSHISAYMRDNKILTPTELKEQYQNMIKGTKSGTIEERTGSAGAINLDPFSSANKATRDVLLDYYMTDPLRVTTNILREFKQYSVDELAKYQRGTPEYENALMRRNIADAWSDLFEKVKDDMLSRSYYEPNEIKEIMQVIAKKTVQFTLATVPRIMQELSSNLGIVMSVAPKELFNGISKYSEYAFNGRGSKIMKNSLSAQTDRLFPHGNSTASLMDTKDFDIATSDMQNVETESMRRLHQIYYATIGQDIKIGEKVGDLLISAGDLLISRPVWFATMAKEFKALTGKEIDFKKIEDNDVEYMDENKEFIDKSRSVADRLTTQVVASKNPFVTAPVMSGKSSDIIHMVSTYMNNFRMTEYETARDHIIGLQKGGKITRPQAIRMLAGITLRAGIYKATQAKVMTGLTLLGFGMFGGNLDDKKEDEKGEEEKFIDQWFNANNVKDTPENRKKLMNDFAEKFGWMSKDEEWKDFVKRSTEESNTLFEDFATGVSQTFASLIFGRNFGNITNSLITAPLVEYANKKVTGSEYNKYNDNLMYNKLPQPMNMLLGIDDAKRVDRKWASDFIKNNLGPYGMVLSSPVEVIENITFKYLDEKKLADVEKEIATHEAGGLVDNPKIKDYYKLVDEKKELQNKISVANQKSVISALVGMAIMGNVPSAKTIEQIYNKIVKEPYRVPNDLKQIKKFILSMDEYGTTKEEIMQFMESQNKKPSIIKEAFDNVTIPDTYEKAVEKLNE